MKASEYQRAAMAYASPATRANPLLNAVLGLVGEAGEIADLHKKAVFHGRAVTTEQYRDELGDTLWYCALLAYALGTTLDEIMAANLAKLHARYPADAFDPALENWRKRAPKYVQIGKDEIAPPCDDCRISRPVVHVEPPIMDGEKALAYLCFQCLGNRTNKPKAERVATPIAPHTVGTCDRCGIEGPTVHLNPPGTADGKAYEYLCRLCFDMTGIG